MDVPPSRWRVVERGRRLVVIDTRGETVPDPDKRGTLRAALARTGLPLPRRTRFDGSATLTTRAWYDDKGPRTLSFDPGAMQLLAWARGGAVAVVVAWVVLAVLNPALFFLPLVTLLPGVAAPVRKGLTAWLDRFDADAPI